MNYCVEGAKQNLSTSGKVSGRHIFYRDIAVNRNVVSNIRSIREDLVLVD